MVKKQVATAKAPSPAGPYSQAIIYGNMVYVSGQRPMDPETGELAEGIENQTEQVIKNISEILREAGSSLDNIVRSTVYLSDIGNFSAMNGVYERMMPRPYPSRSTFGVQLRGILVEIDVVAYLN